MQSASKGIGMASRFKMALSKDRFFDHPASFDYDSWVIRVDIPTSINLSNFTKV